jgi:hypothetical protein
MFNSRRGPTGLSGCRSVDQIAFEEVAALPDKAERGSRARQFSRWLRAEPSSLVSTPTGNSTCLCL